MFSINTGMIILGGGVIKHHICNANLMRNGADFRFVFLFRGRQCCGSGTGSETFSRIRFGTEITVSDPDSDPCLLLMDPNRNPANLLRTLFVVKPRFKSGFESGFGSGFESGSESETNFRPDPDPRQDPKLLFWICNTGGRVPTFFVYVRVTKLGVKLTNLKTPKTHVRRQN